MRARVAVLATALATVVAPLFWSPTAIAQPKRVSLLAADDGSDERFISATEATLAPWDIELELSPAPAPGDKLPDAANGARGLAQRLNADAIVWLTDGPEGVSVWVYDRQNDNLIARSIAARRPFDRPGAAAVALTIKTLLRHSEAAPPARRFGSDGSARTRRLQLSAAGGFRVRPGSDSDVEPRLAISLLWLAPVLDNRLEAYLRISSGPGTSVNREQFVGRHADNALSAGLGYRVALGERFALRPGLGATLEATTFDGVVTGASERTDISRVNPSLDGSLTGIWHVGQVQLALRVESSYLFRRQEFLVGGESVFALSSTDVETAFLVTVPLY